jgi:uncharacterized protein
MTHAHLDKRLRAAVLAIALACAAAACGDTHAGGQSTAGKHDLSKAKPAAFRAHGSVLQLLVDDAAPGTPLELVQSDGTVLQDGVADGYGTLIFRNVASGAGYEVVTGDDSNLQASNAAVVTAMTDAPDASFYESQKVDAGYGYIETRDGTLLAINVILPGPAENGPYPTVIEYSGYDPANPDSPQPSTLITSTLGYAAVGVNMRGTGCSGGAFNYFEPAQSTDGYDAVEVIAAQPWVKNHKVGMVGISYPGISQLFTAQLEPPHLVAVAPLSVIADTGRGTLYPGGIYNNGFAQDWAKDRQHDAMRGGQPWSQKRLDAGDQVCIDNQKYRDQTPDILAQARENDYYDPAVADPLSPVTFVHNIDVPVFLAGAWQDEQVGGYFATMLDQFTGTDRAHFSMTNGNHTDPLGPAFFGRWTEFLSFYVREEIPHFPAAGAAVLSVLAEQIFGVKNLTVEPDRFTDAKSFEEALARFEGEPRVRVLFDNGGTTKAEPGAPYPAFEASFSNWPIPELQPTAWYFAANGALVPSAPSNAGADSYLYDPSVSQNTNYHGPSDGVWLANPGWDWQPLQEGKAVAYATAPLDSDLILAGSGSVDLWLKSTAADVDLQVTLSEIRPDGNETYVQNGWLRASHRKIDDARSTELRPLQTHLRADAADLPAGQFTLARVEIFPFAHAFRAGSRIRLSVESPGGDRALWKFGVLQSDAPITNTIAHGGAQASRVVLPVVPGVPITTPLPACPSLRGQPCRAYVELQNQPG